MCGIFGYIGAQNSVDVALAGLKKLEYRGYDSAGIAGVFQGKIAYCKEEGKVSKLEKLIQGTNLSLDIAIAHTRWATHGKPNQVNAHPHFNMDHSLAIVHNGIIENHDSLRKMLQKNGVNFRSETDTEVVAHLIQSLYQGDLLKAIQQVVPMLKGAYALAIIHKSHPDQIIVTAKECPIAIGVGNGETFISSDSNAFLVHTREVLFLEAGEVAIVKADSLQIFDQTCAQVMRKTSSIDTSISDISKGSYEHYTLKEIFEQPQTIRNALLSRFVEDYGTISLEGLKFEEEELLGVKKILIVACGTSWHAGNVAAYMLEDLARIPTQVEIASELRYKNPIVPEGTLAIAISQSGETADTIAAMRELKAKGAKVLGICNVQGSTLAREASSCLFLHAGPEIGVCSTKAFTSQLIVLSLFTVLMARMRSMSKSKGQQFIAALRNLPEQVQKVLEQAPAIEKIAKKYAKYDNFFFLGRRYMYPASLEGALKLKEISYINANGYPAGELKHGPIALINEKCPTIALCGDMLTYEKTLSNLMEVKARSGMVIAIAPEGAEGLDSIANDLIHVPRTIDELAPIPATVATQLLAYYIAKERGTEIDQPRNLAKSVTVE